MTARDVSDARRLQRQMDSRQSQDSLTSLLSRDAFLVGLRRLLRTRDAHDEMAIVVLDLERFTALNDTLGHDSGDEILVAVARTFEHLPGAVRAAARLSGDAFAWVLIASDIEQAVVESIEMCHGELRGLILADGRETEVVFRAGYAVVEENPGQTADWYLEAADLALARSRSSRHALLVGYHEDMRAETERRVAAERLLRWAIAERRLEMYRQPVVRLEDGTIDGLKIDRSFVSVLGSSGQGLTLARLVVQLARALDLRAVAEGIETVEQADLLRGLGCDFGHGYLYARPMPVDDYVEWMLGSLTPALLT